MYRTLAERIAAFEASDVYPVVTAEFCAGRDPAAVAEAVLAGGAKVIQIREKTMPDGAFLELLRRVRRLADRYGALLIADARVDADAPCRRVALRILSLYKDRFFNR